MYAENQLGKLYEGSDKTGKDMLKISSEAPRFKDIALPSAMYSFKAPIAA